MELYMVCVLIAFAMSMLIFKGVQLVLSIIHPLPSEADIQWRQYPQLPLDHNLQQVKIMPNKSSKKPKPKEPKSKRPPRNVRLEQIYSGSPYSFEELDSSFSRRSASYGTTNKGRSSSRLDEFVNGSSNGSERREQQQHLQQVIPLEQISFVEDDEEDPIEAYVQRQHQRMIQETYQNPSHRASTPIQNYSAAPSRPSPNPKSHTTIV